MKSKRINGAHRSRDFLGVQRVGMIKEVTYVLMLRTKESDSCRKSFNAREIVEDSKVFKGESLGQCYNKLLKKIFRVPYDKKIIDLQKQINGERAMSINK